jgi:hypothetical protein
VSRRRLHPRHVTDVVQVATFTGVDDVVGAWAESKTLRAHVEASDELVTVGPDATVAGLLRVAVPPLTGVDVAAVLAPSSSVTYRGRTSWVLKVVEERRQGMLVATVATTGPVQPRFGGGWQVQVSIRSSAGRDRRGNPTTETTTGPLDAFFTPAATSDPADFSEAPTTTGTLRLPLQTPLASTDRVQILTSPAAGVWTVEGEAFPDGATLKATVRRST